jgi:hypothetical protein
VRKHNGPWHPLEQLPGWPDQCAFMRVELSFCLLRPFMSEDEQLAIRQRIYQWDVSHAIQPDRKKA